MGGMNKRNYKIHCDKGNERVDELAKGAAAAESAACAQRMLLMHMRFYFRVLPLVQA